MNEATARLKINKLLESAGWQFFDEGDKPANIRLEAGVEINTLGDNFEKTRNRGTGSVQGFSIPIWRR